MANQFIESSRKESIVEIRLNCPKRRNALTLSAIEELANAITQAGQSDARGVLLSAEGPAFCAGHDFADMVNKSESQLHHLMQRCSAMMESIQRIPQPVVAAVQGAAYGAGCQLALSCDLVVASEDATFCTPGGKGGWFCTTPMVTLSRAIGSKRALEMLFSGEPISSSTALEWGMINRRVAGSELLPKARELLELVTRGSRESKATGKRAFYAQIGMDQHNAYQYAAEIMARAGSSSEAQEMMNAFVQKRSAKS